MRSDIEPEPEFHGEIYPSASGHGRVCTTGSGIDRNVGFIAPPSVWKSTTRMKTRSWMHQSFWSCPRQTGQKISFLEGGEIAAVRAS